MPSRTAEPIFFFTPVEFRNWLRKNSSSATELFVGFRKVRSGLPSITWSEAVDEALSFGWIDSVRHRIDDTSYTNRFTPRKPGSTWSSVNIEKVRVLVEAGRMQPAGLEAFSKRAEARSRTYSYEQEAEPVLLPGQERLFRKNKAAWAFFEQQPPSYRKRVFRWVVTGKQEATQTKRLAALIEASENGRRL